MQSEKKKRLGFRDPATNITRSCLDYMGRIMELREFVGFYFNFVKSSQEFKSRIEQSPNEAQDSELSGKAVSLTKYNFSAHKQLVNELMLSRAVESFDLYVLNILREIFAVQPEILKSNKKVDVATLLELRTPEEIIFYLAENQLNELGYKPMTELQKWILERTGVDLFLNNDVFGTALLATEVRNLIAHNDCKINHVAMERLGERYSMLEISEMGKVKLSDDWLRKTCYTLDGIVFDFDERIGQKFDVYQANRYGSFLIRE